MTSEAHTTAILALDLLCQEFNIPAHEIPILVWSRRTTNGRFRWRGPLPGNWKLIIGPRCWRGWELALLHEFAHYLVHRSSSREQSHGKRFHYELTRIAAAWYGDAARYDWSTEYRSFRSGPAPLKMEDL